MQVDLDHGLERTWSPVLLTLLPDLLEAIEPYILGLTGSAVHGTLLSTASCQVLVKSDTGKSCVIWIACELVCFNAMEKIDEPCLCFPWF